MGGRLKVCAFIYNPRLFRKFKDIAEKFAIEYSVPNTMEDIENYDIVIVDEEAHQLIERSSKCVKKGPKIAVVSSEEDMISLISSIIAGNEENIRYLVVGVDLGSKIAYAVFADNLLISVGITLDLNDFLATLSKLRTALRPSRAVIKIGLPGSDELYQLLLKLLKAALRYGYEAYIIDESRTTARPLPRFRGLKNVRTTKDINAAVNIALKDGGIRIDCMSDLM
ncbi:MAG: hypothetical protein DRO14_02900 [Thermoprotei archaeon]|nr:MAG: hypothetical protein DRO14_02900 [Thermoprotei archaeon]